MGRPSVRQVPIQWSDREGAVDIPPVRDAGIFQTFQEDQGPLIIHLLGATGDSSGPPEPLKARRRHPLLEKSKELQPGLKKKSGRRIGRAQALGRQVSKRRPNG